MTDILLPKYPQASSEDWMMFEWVLPHGYRHVASVQRPSSDGNVMTGDIYDLGQNAEGLFRLFRRGTGEFGNSHVGNGEPLSDADVAGFGLTREQCPEDVWQEDGEYSSLCKTHLINH
jgi:hypothetical protein